VSVDLDDTLFPQEAWLSGAWAAVAQRASLLGLDGAALLPVLNRVCAEGSDRGGIIDRSLVAIGAEPARYAAALVSAFRAHRPSRLLCYPNAARALRRLAAVLPVVCVTDGNPRLQQGKLAALGLTDLFRAVVVSDQLGGRSVRKPHPAPFLAALDVLGLPPGDVVHIGDRPTKDMAGAAGVGMRSVRVRTGEYAGAPDLPSAPPWRTARTFAEAVELCLAGAAGGAAAGNNTGARAV
jgi:putative hydrolase of the HAD superfamily